MKRLVILLFFFAIQVLAFAQRKPFKFAFVSDTHIGSPDGKAEEDLRRTVADINATTGLAFVVLTGDITEMGTNDEIARAKAILDSLNIPWYILPGNHDTGWSESGGVTFTKVFGYSTFNFEYEGIRFIGCASGPYVRMSDGHIPREAVNWLDTLLHKIPATQPIIFLNHYPIDNSLDNWYEVTDRLMKKNTLAILCGHGHGNHAFTFDGIPGVMGRSNLRAKAAVGGYNVVSLDADSMYFTEKRPGTDFSRKWTAVNLHATDRSAAHLMIRPSYAINDSFPFVKPQWTFSAPANIASTPAVTKSFAFVGDLAGTMYALHMRDGTIAWKMQTGGSIFSSPAIESDRLVFGSGDGSVYCLNQKTGNLTWKFETRAAVLASPLIANKKVFIASSDHSFRCLEFATGNLLWEFNELKGSVVSTPVLSNGHIIFGSWDTYLYSLDAATGKLAWKWSNGSSVRNLSPASCIPVVKDGVVYIVAPDRFITAIDEKTGNTLWRSNESTVRESMGVSGDGKLIYGKTMQDTVVAFATGRNKQPAVWKMHVGFGYEHVPSMLKEKDGAVFFGTRNGVVYSIDPKKQSTNWAYKLDNSMVNTVRPLGSKKLMATTMDGKVELLHWSK